MRGKKKTTAPITPAATGGEQSSMHICSLSIAEKNADYKFLVGRKLKAKKGTSVTLASIGVVTPQYQIRWIWQGLRPLHPALVGVGANA